MKYFFFFRSVNSYYNDIVLLIFRVVIGLSLMTHGYGKLIRLMDGNIWGRTHFIFNEEISMALVVFGEFFAPLFVVIGLGTRIFALSKLSVSLSLMYTGKIHLERWKRA